LGPTHEDGEGVRVTVTSDVARTRKACGAVAYQREWQRWWQTKGKEEGALNRLATRTVLPGQSDRRSRSARATLSHVANGVRVRQARQASMGSLGGMHWTRSQ
jgi:hypothetical protein